MRREKKYNTKYIAEFKIAVTMDMHENHLSYRETARKYKIAAQKFMRKSERAGKSFLKYPIYCASRSTTTKGKNLKYCYSKSIFLNLKSYSFTVLLIPTDNNILTITVSILHMEN